MKNCGWETVRVPANAARVISGGECERVGLCGTMVGRKCCCLEAFSRPKTEDPALGVAGLEEAGACVEELPLAPQLACRAANWA